ncbi:MAG: CocE/NonD family hydrolase [Lewinellaceae bacterium]|nr:CocE/NonD family hydrolase [Phaeodactylibacter sp.]MCB9350113.1 CocE/NonD family hydrolase [Lewinellaceae bacterium]
MKKGPLPLFNLRPKTRWRWPLILAIALLAGPLSSSYGQEAAINVTVEHNVMIPAGDSVLLATDIYRPAVDGQPVTELLPLLLQRTPYGKSEGRFAPQAAYFASQGYVVALQDLRGRYDSGGTFTKYNPLEAADGAQTVEWLSRLPYVDGRVAMWGTSYGAHTQADASKLNPEGLSAMVINMGGMANAWDHAVRQGGAFELGRELTWAFRQIPMEVKDPVVQAHFEREQIEDWYPAWPFRRGLNPLSIAPNFENYVLEEYRHGDYDDFWKGTGINWEEYYGQTADVPMVHIGGWYDIFLSGTIQNYQELSLRQSTPKWLIIGPWTHSGNERTYAGDVDFGPEAAITDFNRDFQVRWFDHLLKEKKSEAIPEKPVQLFVMGTGDGKKNEAGRLNHGGYWMEADSWPLPDTKPVFFYFHADGSLNNQPPGEAASSTTFTFDPTHPVPTLGGNVSARVKDGAYDQRERPDFIGSRPPYLPLSARGDVVVFQTEPLEEDMQAVGPIIVCLCVSSTAEDTDFTVKLLDVYPPSEDFPSGFDMNLTDGIVRMSYRNGRPDRELIRPGEAYNVVIKPFPTANVFKKGHRIRVDISSSNFPRWDVNPNTGEPFESSRRKVSADNTVFHYAERPSYIVLPIVPLGKW